MKGAIDAVILMIFIGLGIVAFVMIVPGMLSDIGRNFCVRDQFSEIRNIEEIGKEVSIGIKKATGFDVKWCTKCIWFEENSTHKWLKVWIKGEKEAEIKYVENRYLNIGSNKDNSRLNKDDFEYSFWITKGEINCTNCDNETIVSGCD